MVHMKTSWVIAFFTCFACVDLAGRAGAQGLLTKVESIAWTGMHYPRGSGTFWQFRHQPVIDGSTVVFIAGAPWAPGGGFQAKAAFKTDGQSWRRYNGEILQVSLDGSALAMSLFNGDNTPQNVSVQGTTAIVKEQDGQLVVVVDGATEVPGSSFFSPFFELHTFDAGRVLFDAEGLYLEKEGTVSIIADSLVVAPGGGLFAQGNIPFAAQAGARTFFTAVEDAAGDGVFLSEQGVLTRLVDERFPVPGGSGNFDGFLSIAARGRNAVIIGKDAMRAPGVYRVDGGIVRRVVAVGDPVPGGQANFADIATVAADGELIVFVAADDAGRGGVFAAYGDALYRLIGRGDVVAGRIIRDVACGKEAVSGRSIVCWARTAGGIETILRIDIATLPPLPEVVVPQRALFARDFDGDTVSDVAVFEPSTGNWYILESATGSLRLVRWGYSETIPVPGDYDGDGLADITVFAPATGKWYILQSDTSTLRTVEWGNPETLPVPADYDGDGEADIAVFEVPTGNWHIRESSSGAIRIINWGYEGVVPVPGNYDGVGGDDIAVFEPSTGNWYILESSTQQMRLVQWGHRDAQPVPADYDGDGLVDIAVFEPATGNWYIRESATTTLRVMNWGYSLTTPVPGVFDANAQADITVYERPTGRWYILESGAEELRSLNWGYQGSVPAL